MCDVLNGQHSRITGSHTDSPHTSTRPEEFSVPVVHNQGEATLVYKRSEGYVFLQRCSPKGNIVNIASIPIWYILNVENLRERQERLRRNSNDANESDQLFASWNVYRSDAVYGKKTAKLMNQVREISRKMKNETIYLNSPVVIGTTVEGSNYSSIASEKAAFSEPALGSPAVHEDYDLVHHLYYVKHSSKPSLVSVTLEFASLSDTESCTALQQVVQKILSDVYPRGEKRLILVVSPKSGSGNAIKICQQRVIPVLHFTRHSLKVVVTTRAGYCEDYVADPTNEITGNDVLVCVGGDGIIHECVNGLDRRGLINSWNYPVSSTNCSNSHNEDSDNNTRNTTPPTDATITGDATHTQDILSMRMGDEANEGKNKIDGFEGETQRKEHQRYVMNGSDSEAAPACQRLNLQFPGLSQIKESSSVPMVATIPAGSGCGMAKTLGVVTLRESLLALVHLKTCVKDLMRLRFEHGLNGDKKDKAKNDTENQGPDRGDSLASGLTPLSGLVSDSMDRGEGVNSSLLGPEGATSFTNRIALMTTTFGIVNKIDQGSEKFRFFGNCRFLLYSIYMFFRGMRSYGARLRYLPWQGHGGCGIQKIHESDVMPSEVEFPHCTMDHSCLHCRLHNRAPNISSPSDRTNTVVNGVSLEAELPRSREGEGNVNFDDAALPWVTLDGNHCSIFISNIREVAKDVMMTPFAHMSDGAIDIVFSQEKEVKHGRGKFLRFFLGLEEGKHVHLPFVGYVKAQAIELEALEEGLMTDGEVIPFTRVRITPVRCAVEFVRGE